MTVRCLRAQESDPSARRNAFLMLFNCAQDLAVDYYLQHAEETTSFGDGFQLIVLELTRKVCTCRAVSSIGLPLLML